MAVGKALCKVGGLVFGAVCSLRVCRALSEHTKRDKGAPGNLDLVAAQVVFRHGARTPCTTLGDTALDPSWDRRVLLGDLPHTAIDYEVRNILGGPRPVSQYDRHQMKNEMKVRIPRTAPTRDRSGSCQDGGFTPTSCLNQENKTKREKVGNHHHIRGGIVKSAHL